MRALLAFAVVLLVLEGWCRGTPALAAATEEELRAADAPLYEVARKYFPNDDASRPAKRIFRLTRDQIDATVQSLLPGYVAGSVKAFVPKDPLQTNYEYAEHLNFNAANLGGLSTWIRGIAARVKERPGGLIDCAGGAADPECLADRARRFAVAAFRGDVSTERSDAIVAFFLDAVRVSGVEQATADLVEVVLNSPHFLFRKELEVSRRGRLDPGQHLQAISYTIADVPPERLGLISTRALSYLQTADDVNATIAAAAASKEAREKLARFVAAWLEIKDSSEFTISRETYREFTPELAEAMAVDSRRLLQMQLAKADPTLKDVTQSTEALVSKELAPVIGSGRQSAQGSTLVALDRIQRLGIFTHPALIASHSGPVDTRPMKRGVFWVRKVMCQELGEPPKSLHLDDYKAEGATERDRIEAMTKSGSCIGCHKVINPFAYFQEAYDALGRWRDTENGTPIDTSITLDLAGEAPIRAANTIEAVRKLTSSQTFKQCFVRQMFRYYMGRQEEPGDDPLLRRMFFEFSRGDGQKLLPLISILAGSSRMAMR